MSENTDVHAVFAKIAGEYDAFNLISSLGVNRHWLRCVVRSVQRGLERIPSDPNTRQPRVLDVAGGTGDVAFAMARALPAAHIVLSDFCEPMLEVAAARIEQGALSRNEASRLEMRVADAQALPFPDASFDAVTCSYGIRNVPDRPAALAEMHRVLKPGGLAVILEFSRPPQAAWRALYTFYLLSAVPAIGKMITGDNSEFRYLKDSILAFPPQEAFCEMLYAAGFADISYQNLTGGIVALYKSVKGC